MFGYFFRLAQDNSFLVLSMSTTMSISGDQSTSIVTAMKTVGAQSTTYITLALGIPIPIYPK